MSAPSKPDPQYEHRIVATPNRGDPIEHVVADPAEAGRFYRTGRAVLPQHGGGSVEIQRRPVGEWETIERADVPAPAPGMPDVSGMAIVAPGDLPPPGVSFSGTVQSGGTVTIRGFRVFDDPDELPPESPGFPIVVASPPGVSPAALEIPAPPEITSLSWPGTTSMYRCRCMPRPETETKG